MEWKNLYRGIAMGVSDVVPGISGGTIAVIFGIYDQLIKSINGLFSRKWKANLGFLIPLGLGMAFAIFSFSRLMGWLLAHHEQITYYFFLGLIIGILPYLARESKVTSTFKWYHYLFLIGSAVLISMLPLNPEEGTIIVERSLMIYVSLFFAGFIASAAMILPGISGSLVLLLLGFYSTVINAINTLDITVIVVVGVGIAAGIVTMSKVIHFCLTHFRIATFAVIIGLVIGSVYVIFPGWATSFSQMLWFVFVFAAGLLVAYVLGKVEY